MIIANFLNTLKLYFHLLFYKNRNVDFISNHFNDVLLTTMMMMITLLMCQKTNKPKERILILIGDTKEKVKR